MSLFKNSLTHPHHPPKHTSTPTSPNTPISTPSDLPYKHLNTPTTHRHKPPLPPRFPQPHTQSGNLENKRLKKKKKRKKKKKLTLFNSLCLCIWIGTNLDWVSFEKLRGFQEIHLVLSLGFICSFLNWNIVKKTFHI